MGGGVCRIDMLLLESNWLYFTCDNCGERIVCIAGYVASHALYGDLLLGLAGKEGQMVNSLLVILCGFI